MNKGGAPYKNKNAEKWTINESQVFINSVYDYVKSNKDCCSMEEACCELGQYEKIINYLERKFNYSEDNENETVSVDFNPIKKARGILKNRIIKMGLTNKYNPTMAIFVLKNNHDMDDKHIVDENIKGNLNVTPLEFFKTNKDK